MKINAPNKIIKELSALSSTHMRKKSDLFLAEGERLVSSVPKGLIKYYVLPEKSEIVPQYGDLPVYTVSEKEYFSFCQTVNPQGIACVCKKFTCDKEELFVKSPALIVLCENLQDPGNLGTIIRTTDAAGASGLILTKGCCDIFNPKVLRSAMGSVFNLPILTNVDFEECAAFFKSHGIQLSAAHLKGEKTPYETDMKQPTAILIGNEAKGLSQTAEKAADRLVKLPMLGKAESLNAAVAAALIIYEAVRQRYTL